MKRRFPFKIRRGMPKGVKPRKHKKSGLIRFYFMLTCLLILALAAAGYYRFDRAVMPLALSVAEQRVITTINHALLESVKKNITANGLSASDFYIRGGDNTGDNKVLAVNTILVNDICAAAAKEISECLNLLGGEKVSVPFAVALGLDTLSNSGPQYSFAMMSTGNAQVNYESKFESVGINQIHFEVWLQVTATVRLINPVQAAEFAVTRNISLVDTVIAGEVPEMYFNYNK